MEFPRVLAVLGNGAWRAWIDPFLEHPSYVFDRMVPADSPDALLAAVRRQRYDAIAFLSRHGTLARDLGFSRFPALATSAVVVQPSVVVKLAKDKRAMARRAESIPAFLPIPEVTPPVARRLLEAGGLRAVVAKPSDGTAGKDLHVFTDPGALSTTGTRLYEGGHVLQPFIDGEEYSVMTVWHEGRCNVYPPVSKGPTRPSGVHPSLRQRTCPAPLLDEAAWRELARGCVAYLRPFEPCGPVEFEFIRARDETFLLEVNPRVAATLRITAAASRTNPLADLIRAAVGVAPLGRAVAPAGYAVEWRLPPDLAEDRLAELRAQERVWVSTRVTVADRDRPSALDRAARLRARFGAHPAT